MLFMEPRPKHRRLRGGHRSQKMDAAMEPGVWLGRSEESDEHLVGTPRGVIRARTVRRLIPDKRWNAEVFLGFRGLPWDVYAGSVPKAPRPKVMVHFALPPSEVVPRTDGTNLTAGDVLDDASDAYSPETPVGEAGRDESHPLSHPDARSDAEKGVGVRGEGGDQGGARLHSPRGSADKRSLSPADMLSQGQEKPGKALVVEDEPSSPTKRAAEIPTEELGPRSPAGPEVPEAMSSGGVLEVYETVDEESFSLPEEAWDWIQSDDTEVIGPDHPDSWSEERWIQESLKGKAKELKCLKEYQVYKAVPREQSKGKKYVSTRWEEVPKWKEGRWVVRSRFVAREFKWKDPDRDDVFGVTSSSNTGRILDYLMVKNGWQAYLADCTCAFFHAPEEEEVYVEPPEEWKAEFPDCDYVWQLTRQLYGRRIAPRAFSDFAAGILVQKVGMKRCIEVPHLYFHEGTSVCLEVHVDDFYAVGPGGSAGGILDEVGKHMTLTREGPYGIGSSFCHLKRVRTVTVEGMTIAPSPNHIKKLLKVTGLNDDSKGRDTPITKPVVGGEDDDPLSAELWKDFRAAVGLLLYMSTDRPDIQYTVNELSSLMSKPTARGWEAVKHLVRYLLKTRNYALFFGRSSESCDDVLIMTDSDWAADQQNRKSKSAVHIYVGDCLLYSYTRRQTVIAQSSAEAEFYATASGVSEGILLRKVLAFFGQTLGLRALTDSAANNAMTHRLGVGKIRHLQTKVLWLQQLVYEHQLVMSWKAGRYNNADLGTKVLQKARFEELIGMCGLRDTAETNGDVQQVSTALAKGVGLSRRQLAEALSVLVTWLQIQGGAGQATEEPEAEDRWFLLTLGVIGLIGILLWSLLTSLIFWKRSESQTGSKQLTLELSVFKATYSTVVHLDRSCTHLRRSKKVDEWAICKDCAKSKLKLD